MTNPVVWLLSALAGALFFYKWGKKAGQYDEQKKTQEKVLAALEQSYHFDSLDDVELDRLPSKYD